MNEFGDGLPAGSRIEEFEIVRELGRGGFGITYLARDRALDRLVAVKEYFPVDWSMRQAGGSIRPRSTTMASDYAWGLEKFVAEARVLARLDHPGIVRVHRIVEAGGSAYMAMEHIDGHSLADELLKSGPLPAPRVHRLLQRLAEGLAEVHAAGLLHRDVKPANVMLRARDGSPVLIDFGAARQHMGQQSRSITAVLTPGYAPIEQYSPKGRQGPWTDVYALGALGYAALTGRVPDDATVRVTGATLRPVGEVAPFPVTGELAGAVMAALATDSRERPQGMGEWIGVLAGTGEAPVDREAGTATADPSGGGVSYADDPVTAGLKKEPGTIPSFEAEPSVNDSHKGGLSAVPIWLRVALPATAALVAALILWPGGDDPEQGEALQDLSAVSQALADSAGQAEARAQTVADSTKEAEAAPPESERKTSISAFARDLPEGRICTAVYSPESCWMELADRPGCYLWNPSPQENETVTWTGVCSNGLTQGGGRVEWYQSDELNEVWETRLQDGRRDGPYIGLNEDGETFAEGQFANGERHGTWTFFRDGSYNNIVREEYSYVNGEGHGNWISIYEGRDDKLVRSEGPGVQSEHYTRTFFYEGRNDKMVREEVPYMNDKPHGTATWFYENGKLGGGPFVHGERHGTFTQYLGEYRIVTPYVNGERHGTETVYDPSGDVFGTTRYENGKRVPSGARHSLSIQSSGRG